MLAPTENLPPLATTPDERSRLAAEQFDSRLSALLARFTSGLSPVSLALAQLDWSLHLLTQPAQAGRLNLRAAQGVLTWLGEVLGQSDNGNGDIRFSDPAWQTWPWRPLKHAYHGTEDWWADATDLRGMTPHHREVTRFFARQWLDMLAPTNYAWLNPEIVRRTQERVGANWLDGAANAMDTWRSEHGLPKLLPPKHTYSPGRELAATPGKVVHRNHLVELIQYLPTTPSVHAEPVLIVPSWIMKYYILDLSAHNSLVAWLVSRGHTVFILSWRNPDESDALLSMEDYLELGIFDSLAAVRRLIPDQAVHACGYCLGGTLLSIGAAALARPSGIRRAEEMPALASVTLLAAETDFSEPGEMGVLIDEAQVSLLEDMMAERGFLTGPQMAGSFAYLHSRDQVWSRRIREYCLGEPTDPNDLMAWNSDLTRMPAVMHSEYLRRCYLRNELAEGRFPVEGHPVALSDIDTPMFVVGTEKDHVSPWKSVYKIHHLFDGDIRFVLTSGGHNAGIVSEPGHPGRHFAWLDRPQGGAWLSPEDWLNRAPRQDGSWWTEWSDWMIARGSGRRVPARRPAPEDVLEAAPGTYVHQRYLDLNV